MRHFEVMVGRVETERQTPLPPGSRLTLLLSHSALSASGTASPDSAQSSGVLGGCGRHAPVIVSVSPDPVDVTSFQCAGMFSLPGRFPVLSPGVESLRSAGNDLVVLANEVSCPTL